MWFQKFYVMYLHVTDALPTWRTNVQAYRARTLRTCSSRVLDFTLFTTKEELTSMQISIVPEQRQNLYSLRQIGHRGTFFRLYSVGAEFISRLGHRLQKFLLIYTKLRKTSTQCLNLQAPASSIQDRRFDTLQRTLFIYLINKYISLFDICLTVHH